MSTYHYINANRSDELDAVGADATTDSMTLLAPTCPLDSSGRLPDLDVLSGDHGLGDAMASMPSKPT